MPVSDTDSAGVGTPLLSVRRIPEFLQAPTAHRRLREALAEPVAALPTGTCLSVAEYGQELFSVDAAAPMTPASAQKLLTALGALRLLGPGSVLTTRVVVDEPPVNGVVLGDLWLVGGGSGHGFKHAPVIGEWTADMVFRDKAVAPLFGLQRFRRRRAE